MSIFKSGDSDRRGLDIVCSLFVADAPAVAFGGFAKCGRSFGLDIDLCQIAKVGDPLQPLLRCVNNNSDALICKGFELFEYLFAFGSGRDQGTFFIDRYIVAQEIIGGSDTTKRKSVIDGAADKIVAHVHLTKKLCVAGGCVFAHRIDPNEGRGLVRTVLFCLEKMRERLVCAGLGHISV